MTARKSITLVCDGSWGLPHCKPSDPATYTIGSAVVSDTRWAAIQVGWTWQGGGRKTSAGASFCGPGDYCPACSRTMLQERIRRAGGES